jgi:predicted RNase H-related nuclease YkuK (DUF458 family)
MKNKIDLDEVREFIRNTSDATRVYLGVDSERYILRDTWYADYTLAIVVHYDGCHGCKIFGEIQTERDYDQRKDRPRYRLMNEVYKVSKLYIDLAEALEDRHFEIHLDINSDDRQGSYCVMQEAVGYVRSMCNVIPMIKPNAFAATYAADRYKSLMKLNA